MFKIAGLVSIVFLCFAGGVAFQRIFLTESAADKAAAVEAQVKILDEEINDLLSKKRVLETSLPKIREAAAFEEAMK
jgi:hypothetical protein